MPADQGDGFARVREGVKAGWQRLGEWKRARSAAPILLPCLFAESVESLGQLAKFGCGVGIELHHDHGAPRIDGPFRDLHLVGDLFVKSAGNDAIEDLSLA
jgi:hypothetical protein